MFTVPVSLNQKLVPALRKRDKNSRQYRSISWERVAPAANFLTHSRHPGGREGLAEVAHPQGITRSGIRISHPTSAPKKAPSPTAEKKMERVISQLRSR